MGRRAASRARRLSPGSRAAGQSREVCAFRLSRETFSPRGDSRYGITDSMNDKIVMHLFIIYSALRGMSTHGMRQTVNMLYEAALACQTPHSLSSLSTFVSA